ncbi:hypothetical protein Esti_001430 [Eimeria stiedai]
MQEVAELKLLNSSQSPKSSVRLLVAWAPECLKDLHAKLPQLLRSRLEEEGEAIEVFGKKDTFTQGRRVMLNWGVFKQDRVGARDLQEAAARKKIGGRNAALWLFVKALGLHARLGLSLRACFGNCREQMRKRFARGGPFVLAAYYATLSTDVLTISTTSNNKQYNASMSPSAFLSSLRSVGDKMSASQEDADKAVGEGLSAALRCVTSVSADRRVEIPDLSISDTKLENNAALKKAMHAHDSIARKMPTPQTYRGPSGLPGDPFHMRQWYLHSFFGYYTLAADKAWQELNETENATPVVLAVLDTGCYLHQDFIDGFDVASSIFWENSEELDCLDGVDNDGNGYVDDCFGWNFVDENGYPFVDDTGHGTLVTSVAAARAHDGKGGRGVMYNPTVMCLKVGSRRGVWTSATVPALDYAIKMKARVSNHSYGGAGMVAAEYEAFLKALKHDHLIVTAAGNSGCNVDASENCFFTPGAFRLRGLVNVMASDISGFRASFSNYGLHGVDVAAPGTMIYAGTNHRAHSGNRKCTSCYTYCDGTSFAAPMVAGMAASLWSYFEATRPAGWRESDERPSRKVEQAIMYSVTGSPALAGALGTGGVVSMWRAMQFYNEVPGPFKPAYSPWGATYDPDFNGLSKQRRASTAALLLAAFAAASALFQLI